jgi:hypothetical protein
MATSGLLNMQNPADQRLARKIIDFTGIASELSLDEKNAIRENIAVKNGQVIDPPEDFENHDTHLYVHNQFRKTPEYRALKKAAPLMDGAMKAHIQATMAMIPPPPPPEIPKKMNLQVKAEAGTPSGDQTLTAFGITPPPPPPMPTGPIGPEGAGLPPGIDPNMLPPEMPGEKPPIDERLSLPLGEGGQTY